MLPKEFSDRTKQVGNTALEGTFRYDTKKAEKMKELCESIYLANEPEFQEVFVGHMNFS